MVTLNKRITTADISAFLGISRNTVSKALNNHPGIAEHTKQKIIDQAIAMGYQRMTLAIQSIAANRHPTAAGSIAFLSKRDVGIEPFWMNVMGGIEEVIRTNNLEMKLSFIRKEDIDSLIMPQVLGSGIHGFVLAGNISEAYSYQLMKSPLPKVFIDIHSGISFSNLRSDIVLMESEDSTFQLTRELIASGHRTIGFIGDLSIRSYLERWLGFVRAHYEEGLFPDPAYCFTSENPSSYHIYEEVAGRLSSLEVYPSAYVCANDAIALNVIKFFRDIGWSVPGDIAITGFDRIKEIEFLDFTLTSVKNNEYRLGVRAAEQLLLRLREPHRPPEIIRLPTSVIFGESTSLYRKTFGP